MNQKGLEKLDPKLQADYHRVMGTPLPQKTTQPKQQLSPQSPTPPQTNQPPKQHDAPYTFHAGQVPIKRSGEGLIVFLILGGILFFLLYTFVWITLFDIRLPFSLPF